MRKLAHLVGKLLELKGPTGTTWYVGLIRSGNNLVLQPGLNDFASANNISQDDHLIFKFVGGSKFEVFIFEPTGCEKGGSLEKEEQKQELEQDEDESLVSIIGVELSKEVQKFDKKEKDKQHEIQCEIEISLLNKREPSNNNGQEVLSASNDSIPLEELRKILYQKGKLHKSKGETKMKRPSVVTKNPSEKLEQKEEEDKETGSDSVPTGKLLLINPHLNKHYIEIHGETETPPMKRPRQNSSNFLSTKGQKGKSLQFCYNNYTSRKSLFS
jgi:B3 DNA binding domain